LIIGIDVGGTKVALAAADRDGTERARTRRATEPGGDPRADVERMIADVDALLAESGASRDAVEAVGLSVPGPVDRTKGMVLHPPNLPGWGEVPIGAWFDEAFDCPVRVENDANAAALAEWRFGAGQGLRDVVYLTMSTGVGGGLILDGRLYAGHSGTAGELGHVPVARGGEACACGLHGCLEAYCGGAGWAARLRAQAPEGSAVRRLADPAHGPGPREVLAAVREGDAYGRAELDRWLDYLALAIVQLGFVLAPEAVILGTIAVAAGEELCFEPLRARVAEGLWPHQAPHMRILPAALGDALPYRAGLCLAMEAVANEGSQAK